MKRTRQGKLVETTECNAIQPCDYYNFKDNEKCGIRQFSVATTDIKNPIDELIWYAGTIGFQNKKRFTKFKLKWLLSTKKVNSLCIADTIIDYIGSSKVNFIYQNAVFLKGITTLFYKQFLTLHSDILNFYKEFCSECSLEKLLKQRDTYIDENDSSDIFAKASRIRNPNRVTVKKAKPKNILLDITHIPLLDYHETQLSQGNLLDTECENLSRYVSNNVNKLGLHEITPSKGEELEMMLGCKKHDCYLDSLDFMDFCGDKFGNEAYYLNENIFELTCESDQRESITNNNTSNHMYSTFNFTFESPAELDSCIATEGTKICITNSDKKNLSQYDHEDYSNVDKNLIDDFGVNEEKDFIPKRKKKTIMDKSAVLSEETLNLWAHNFPQSSLRDRDRTEGIDMICKSLIRHPTIILKFRKCFMRRLKRNLNFLAANTRGNKKKRNQNLKNSYHRSEDNLQNNMNFYRSNEFDLGSSNEEDTETRISRYDSVENKDNDNNQQEIRSVFRGIETVRDENEPMYDYEFPLTRFDLSQDSLRTQQSQTPLSPYIGNETLLDYSFSAEFDMHGDYDHFGNKEFNKVCITDDHFNDLLNSENGDINHNLSWRKHQKQQKNLPSENVYGIPEEIYSNTSHASIGSLNATTLRFKRFIDQVFLMNKIHNNREKFLKKGLINHTRVDDDAKLRNYRISLTFDELVPYDRVSGRTAALSFYNILVLASSGQLCVTQSCKPFSKIVIMQPDGCNFP